MSEEFSLIAYPSILPHRLIKPNKNKKYINFFAFFYKLLYNRRKVPLAVVTTNSEGTVRYEWLIPFAATTELETKNLPKIDWEENRCDVISIGD